MRAVVQRVRRAAVRVGEETVGEIERGLLVLLGVGQDDGEDSIEWMVRKISRLRVFPDDAGRMNLDVSQIGGQVLLVSQFTLYGDARQGNRPGFSAAAPPERAAPMITEVAAGIRRAGIPVETGRFGAGMMVSLENDGPVTILLDDDGTQSG